MTPSVVVRKIISAALKNPQLKCKFLNRLVPVDATCHPYPDEFKAALTSLVATHMPGSKANLAQSERSASPTNSEEKTEMITEEKSRGKAETTWAVNLTRRSMKTLDRDSVFSICGQAVGSQSDSGYKVSLGDPQYTIVVEVNPLFCGLSIYPGTTHNFNLYRVTHPEEEALIEDQRQKSLRDKKKGEQKDGGDPNDVENKSTDGVPRKEETNGDAKEE
eukprot:GHVN01074894.1.p1 GENE.GHVN01074894.1~~GHVN01074894.1.p1  ORF type:complete len:219 (+),score=38.50 GHVN01074894.1:751-1407(+)